VAVLLGPRLPASGLAAGPAARPAPAVAATYAWPVVGRIIDPFHLPGGPFSAGHRGIDIAAPAGTPVHAASAGVVAFAGSVAGSLFVSIDQPDGVRTTYGYLSSVAVHRGDEVLRDQVIAASGAGHPGKLPAHLHFGARVGGVYINPLPLLVPLMVAPLIHLAPLPAGAAWVVEPRGRVLPRW
jgi:murein DD-endopeptidase MepM/ murein hydrolase activator NlpD